MTSPAAEKGGAGAPGGRPAPLPCLNSNNSTGLGWSDPSPQDRKRVFALRQNAQGFIDYWGRSHALFFTVTDALGLHPREFAKRWDSWKTHQGDWMKGYLKVLEPTRAGKPHYHNLVGTDFDTLPDAFDWESFDESNEAYAAKDWPRFRAARSRYVNSAAPELRMLWAACSPKNMARYGLGRCEILPVRKVGAVSSYVGKYLEKAAWYRPSSWKGVRRTELDRTTSRTWRKASLQFSWVSPGATVWRHRCKQLARALGLPDDGNVSAIGKKLGHRWAYQLRGSLHTADESEWHEFLQVVALRHNTPVVPTPGVFLNGKEHDAAAVLAGWEGKLTRWNQGQNLSSAVIFEDDPGGWGERSPRVCTFEAGYIRPG